jgi:hypothetical protein
MAVIATSLAVVVAPVAVEFTAVRVRRPIVTRKSSKPRATCMVAITYFTNPFETRTYS